MKFTFRPLMLTAMALGLAVSAAAQDAPPPAAEAPPVPVDAPASAQPAPAAAETPAAPPAMALDQFIGQPEYMLNIDLSTGGRVVIQLYPNLAPNHVERIKQLARAGFYDGAKFHRVIDGFMAQTGDVKFGKQGGSSFNPSRAGMGGPRADRHYRRVVHR